MVLQCMSHVWSFSVCSYANYGRACKQKCVLLCDRGIMDGAAYVSKEVWASVLAEKEMDTISAREGE